MMKIIKHKEAKALGLKRYFTGKPCKHGHLTERLVTGGCMECNRIAQLERYDSLPPEQKEKRKARMRKYSIEYYAQLRDEHKHN